MAGRRHYGSSNDVFERQVNSGGGGSSTLVGKPATSLTTGAVSAPDNVVNIYRGTWGSKTWDSTTTKVVAGSTGDFTSTEWVILTKIDGEWIASCLPGGIA